MFLLHPSIYHTATKQASLRRRSDHGFSRSCGIRTNQVHLRVRFAPALVAAPQVSSYLCLFDTSFRFQFPQTLREYNFLLFHS
jgi:hypothetical protein